MDPRIVNFAGRVYGKLTVLRFVETRSRRTYWECTCECGNSAVVSNYCLRTGSTKSCGCIREEKVIPLRSRLLARTRKDPDGCWRWTGPLRKSDGYAYISVRGMSTKMISIHRAAYLEFVGPIPAGFHVDHLCWHPECCNPEHLRAIPARENCARQRRALSATCKHGHYFSGANLYISPSGRRFCRRCLANYSRRYRVRNSMVAV